MRPKQKWNLKSAPKERLKIPVVSSENTSVKLKCNVLIWSFITTQHKNLLIKPNWWLNEYLLKNVTYFFTFSVIISIDIDNRNYVFSNQTILIFITFYMQIWCVVCFHYRSYANILYGSFVIFIEANVVNELESLIFQQCSATVLEGLPYSFEKKRLI